MKNTNLSSHASALYLLSALFLPVPAFAFDSGSTGADGAFNPASDIELQLPPSGIFNYSTIDIPAGVTVTFARNATNTHVTLLASGDVTIAGTIDVSGGDSPAVNDTSQSTDRDPGLGGPGGHDGGYGGLFVSAGDTKGGNGRGIGGGTRSGGSWVLNSTTTFGCGGGGGGFNGPGSATGGGNQCPFVTGGIGYGTNNFFTLRGGSGGGGAAGGANNVGSGGGGGGGALLIASSGTVNITGSIVANGGNSGNNRDNQGQPGGSGGGGSGGAIRIIATTITGEGAITAQKGNAGTVSVNSGSGTCPQCRGGDGAPGRIKLEAEDLQRTTNSTPGYVFTPPRAVFLPNTPSIRITSVGGVSAPANPTGSRDVVIPGILSSNTLTVEFETTGVPLGTTITLTAKPVYRAAIRTAASTPVSGSVNSGTATVDIDLANGENLLEATAIFDVVASLGQDFSNDARGESVEKVKVAVNSEGQSITTFITASGNEYPWPSNAVALN